MQSGDFGLARVTGPLGFLLSLGQLIIGDASRYQHAFVVIEASTGLIMEARPRGAGFSNVSNYAGRVAYSHMDLTPAQRAGIVDAALSFDGAKYNWLDYVALSLLHLGMRPKWLTRLVTTKNRLICSQLVDAAYEKAGVHLFNDGRLNQDVTPGDLTYVGNVY